MRCFMAALLLAAQGVCAADFLNDDVLSLIHPDHQNTDFLDTFITALEARESTTELEAVLLLARCWQAPSQDSRGQDRNILSTQIRQWRKQTPESLTLAVIEAFLAYDKGGFRALDQVLGHWLNLQPPDVQTEARTAIDVYRQHWALLNDETLAPFDPDPMDHYRQMIRKGILSGANNLEQQAGWIDAMLRNSPLVQAFGDPEVLQQDSITGPLAERLRANVEAYCQEHQADCEQDNAESDTPSN